MNKNRSKEPVQIKTTELAAKFAAVDVFCSHVVSSVDIDEVHCIFVLAVDIAFRIVVCTLDRLAALLL